MGFDSTDHPPEGHLALIGIRERMRQLGGSVRVTSAVARHGSVYSSA
jgi:signal transduction histidine kinase